MSFEKVILSNEGRVEVEKICDFISSLIIKNESEAKKHETDASFKNFYKFESAYKKSNDVYNLDYDHEDLKNYFDSDEIIRYKLNEPENLYKLLNSTKNSDLIPKQKAEKMKTDLQEKLVKDYEEMNKYYRSFVGLPPTNYDIIKISNLDMDVSYTEDGLIELHKVNYEDFPLTYEHLFVKRSIDDIIKKEEELNKTREIERDITYLRFIEKKLSPYFVRKAPEFTLLSYKNDILSPDEFNRFEEAYNKARKYITEIIYIVGLRDRYDFYPIILIQLLLASTFMNYYNLTLRDYSMGKYTKNDIYDILESEGLGNLKIINDIEILRKIVENLDFLNKYKGSEKALTTLFDVIGDTTLTVRGYKLKKSYLTDENLDLKFSNEFYDKNIELNFVENIIIKGSDTGEGGKIIPYDDFVKEDDYWGGISKDTTDEIRKQIKQDLKNQIMQMNFDTLDTKYISLAKTFNIYEKSNEINSVIYMIFKTAFENAEALGYNPLLDTELFYQNIVVTPIDLWASQCYLSSIISGLDDPDTIKPDLACFSSVFVMRNKYGLISFIQDFKKKDVCPEIDITDPNLNRPISEVFNDSTIEKFLTQYNIKDDTSIIELIEEFEKNMDIMYSLADEIIQTFDKDVYEAYFRIWDVNEISYSYAFIYNGCTSYTEYLRKTNPALLQYIETKILEADLPHNNRDKCLYDLQSDILDYFKLYINDYLEGNYNIYIESKANDLSYLADLKILFQEYLSIYKQLYKMEQIFDITNIPRNLIRCFFSKGEIYVKTELIETIAVRYKQFLMKIFNTLDETEISLDHELSFHINSGIDMENPSFENKFIIDIGIVEFLRKYRFDLQDIFGLIPRLNTYDVTFKYTEEDEFLSFKQSILHLYSKLKLEHKINSLDFKLNLINLTNRLIEGITVVNVPKSINVKNSLKTSIKFDHQIKVIKKE